MFKLKPDAEPIPNVRAVARHKVVSGKATLVAAFPNSPTVCPIKIWSTILYRDITIIDIILGTANFFNNFPIGCVPKGLAISCVIVFLPISSFFARQLNSIIQLYCMFFQHLFSKILLFSIIHYYSIFKLNVIQ